MFPPKVQPYTLTQGQSYSSQLRTVAMLIRHTFNSQSSVVTLKTGLAFIMTVYHLNKGCVINTDVALLAYMKSTTFINIFIPCYFQSGNFYPLQILARWGLIWQYCINMYKYRCTRKRSWLRHCTTSRKVAGLIPDGVIGIFHWHNPSDRTMAQGLTQPLTEMSTKNIDMDMSNGWGINKIWRVRSDAHFHSHKWRHAAAAMRANNVLRNSYNTRPLLCARTTCYVTVITRAHCYACA
jgi:hypothetical protein